MNERQSAIIQILAEENYAKSERLMSELHVSSETIRRDLEYLESQGLLKRLRGGAVFETSRSAEIDYSQRIIKNYYEKHAVGLAAAAIVKDNDTLAIAHGTTTLELTKALANRHNLLVFTNTINIAVEAKKNRSTRVFFIGGFLRSNGLCVSGTISNQILSGFRIDKMFFGVGGVSPEDGITDYNIEDSILTRTMMDISRERYALMDYSKLSLTGLKKICDVKEPDAIITDWSTSLKDLNALEKAGATLIIAKKSINYN